MYYIHYLYTYLRLCIRTFFNVCCKMDSLHGTTFTIAVGDIYKFMQTFCTSHQQSYKSSYVV